MLTKVEIRPVSGSPLEINTLTYPLKVFDIVTNIDTHDEKKLSAAGQWPTFHYPDAMTIHAEGACLADTSTAYVTARLALLDAVLPPVTVQTSRYHAALRVRMDGMTEDADANVVVVQQSIPMAALFPANSQFMITWKGFLPYFVGVSSQTQYRLG
jgi:hypothetical protein